MSKIKLKIVENTFWHCEYSNNPMPPVSFSKYVEWDRDVSEEEDLVQEIPDASYNNLESEEEE